MHWKAALVVQTCLTFCTHVAGSAPDGKGQACGILTSSLYRSEYLGRRLGVISATVVAEMNRDLIGVERHELTIEDGNSGTGSSGYDAADAGTVSISVPVAYAAGPDASRQPGSAPQRGSFFASRRPTFVLVV